MKTSIATVSISGTFAEKLAAIAKAGFDGIQIFEQDFIASDFTPCRCGPDDAQSWAEDNAVPTVP